MQGLKRFIIYSNKIHINASGTFLQSFKAGDEDAFVKIYAGFYIRLLNHARRKINDNSIAEDLVQDVFIYLHEHGDVHSNLEAYLFTALRNRIYDYWRRELARGRMEERLFNTGGAEPGDNTYPFELADMQRNITAVINRLPEQCRKVFLMSREEELSNKEIAGRLGISVKTVEAHITKALKYLREHLDYHWVWLLTLLGWGLMS